MAKRGRPTTKTLEDHKKQGTYRPNRHDKLIAPKDRLAELQSPEYILSDDFKVDRKEIFDIHSRYLFEQGMSVEEDSHMLAIMVTEYVFFLEALKIYYSEGPEKSIGRRLASDVCSQHQKEYLNLMNEFKLTPSTREFSKIEKKSEEKDEIGDFIEENDDW